MAGRRKVSFQGNELWAEPIDFETEHEAWNTYVLHDGTTLKMKSVVSEVLRLVDLYTQDGQPVYMVNSTNVLTAVVPDALKKKD